MSTSQAGAYTIELAKPDFKFAAAHFTLLSDGESERLHGHNYRLRVRLHGARLDEQGLLCDVKAVKQRIRALCAELDERTLIPERSARLEIERAGECVEVRCGARHYRFPTEDVKLLPLTNISIEELARLLWEKLAPALAGAALTHLSVEVEESKGQRCRYHAALP